MGRIVVGVFLRLMVRGGEATWQGEQRGHVLGSTKNVTPLLPLPHEWNIAAVGRDSGKSLGSALVPPDQERISLMTEPWSISRRLWPGTSSLCGSRPNWCSTVAWMSVT